ncbi:hypothetical protein [Burkholderia contaminans]|uniref:Uncharacterized protein n=1 Tax=Burkholderia contaminans TaxID=488447 RepID=A0A3N8QS34_9BURK|nr:hypothetical protein [Burkholderia contaminans]RQT22086.1 hypothetical protein DF037_28670 [Burkholderia contaminans]
MIIPILAIGLLISAWLMCAGLQPLLTFFTHGELFQLLQAHVALDGPGSGLIGATYYVPAVVTLCCLGAGLFAAWFICWAVASVTSLFSDYWTER